MTSTCNTGYLYRFFTAIFQTKLLLNPALLRYTATKENTAYYTMTSRAHVPAGSVLVSKGVLLI
jgi:hypothetical protein